MTLNLTGGERLSTYYTEKGAFDVRVVDFAHVRPYATVHGPGLPFRVIKEYPQGTVKNVGESLEIGEVFRNVSRALDGEAVELDLDNPWTKEALNILTRGL